MAKILDDLHIFRNFRKSSHQYENNLIDINILGNKVTSMKIRSNMAKILDNLHIFRNFRKSSHQYENYVKIVSNYLIDINILGN